jgi:transcriptional regulator with XRE-family HTH domain
VDTPEVEVRRLAEALRETIHKRKTSQRQVERALHQGKGYLSQLLNGKADLKLKQVFAVLGVLGVPPEDFFVELYDKSDPVSAVRGLMSRAHFEDDIEDLKNRIARLEKETSPKARRVRS